MVIFGFVVIWDYRHGGCGFFLCVPAFEKVLGVLGGEDG